MRILLILILAVAASPAVAEMVHRDNFRMVPIEETLDRRVECGPFAGNPDRLVYQMITGTCDEPGQRWAMDEVQEVQVTRAWARLGYMGYQVLMLGLADDSLAALEWRFELTPLDGEAWQLDFAGQRWRCHPGRGESEHLTTELCL